MTDLLTERAAVFSPCRRWRYRLERRWGGGTVAAFIMLNPSTADELTNDPTVERCERRARAAGHGILLVGNLFALRSTDPDVLYTANDPVGPENDAYLRAICAAADVVICGWGRHGELHGRGRTVARMLAEAAPGRLYCLGLNGDGSPKHPLYISYAAPLVPFGGAA